jgi:hypothetical protein
MVPLGAIGSDFRAGSRADFCAKILPRAISGGSIFRRATGRFRTAVLQRSGDEFWGQNSPCSSARFHKLVVVQNQLRQSHGSGRQFELESPATEQGLSMSFHFPARDRPISDRRFAAIWR